ncbi:AlkA N-terminal domain-containing protein [Nonomuraea jiangxiensis]|uniref:AraC family transcriptional regulator, regulatory protein of adaptative response / DNA-3-methyladenine glycosylase II n=1 Tax=Nonomuraea jiangxiensis TaxID=633440 RepID=A0A1G8DEU4_9ACTN|nr:AlkA N-terminal domain-containing protein [Nonomuraea jiangxiensis]SDH56161.1 AraC family transcriptional regulator, regulatory protein of adaptative response / DNA-3-methyladenine glycosylase II [Nonomuraea jiangxiensis]
MGRVIDDEVAFAAMESRDPRFDGWFYVAVTTTGIYCRPSCPAVMPKPENVRLFPSAAAAQVHGFRACKRCRPDAAPGSPEWNLRTDLVGRAMLLIAEGIVDREGVAGLAARLGYSRRQVHRQLVAEVGAGPQALARTQRAQTARMLLEAGALPVSDVAFAAGFTSIRQFNDTIRQVYATTPSGLRGTVRDAPAPGAITLRLAYRPPMDVAASLDYLGARAVPGIEEYRAGAYSRSLSLPHGAGVVTLRPGAAHVSCELRLEDLRDLAVAVRRCRRLLDLDADQQAIDAFLGADPRLGPLVALRPGLRVPGCADPAELAFRAVLGRRTRAARLRDQLAGLVAAHGTPLARPFGQVTHLFPDMTALAEAGAGAGAAGRTQLALARALASGTIGLDPGCDPHHVRKQLLDLPGMSRWAVSCIRMRALGDPDVLMPDRSVQRAVRLLDALPDRWRPWRSYATQHLARLNPARPVPPTDPASLTQARVTPAARV